ncbi:MAG: hypothetical protein RIB97_13135 [Nitratireductor sp.]
MEKQLRNNLIKMAQAVCEARGLTEETIALRALRDNTFFRRMRNGAGFTVRTYDRLMGWMQAELQSEDAA